MNVIDWINQSSENGIMNSIKVEPITYYPDSSEEIYCSNKDMAKEISLRSFV